ncbi:hypothetical protein F0L68_01165 [Solihabitans fulvus]|uniref:Uncharacterized protein n=1 Tax=Solihabitans fulvus TaxID=1892852 RepID=A0A5B2XU03_9PSEU|nr:hypothetical protein [Solihabitans fulvus]KAA2267167.1 hypothetical protein F0L68_01165 [Solihabitans fulvus]
MRGTRPLWPYLAAAAAVLVVAGIVVANLRGPDLVPIGPTGSGDTNLTIAGRVVVEPSAPIAGQQVTARVTISADRAVVLRGLVVKARDEAGAFHDFPELADVTVDTTSKELVSRRRFDAPGIYTYYLAYRLDGDWVGLPPWQTVTIGGPSPTTG